MLITYRDKQLKLPPHLAGGTPTSPMLRGSDQLLLDWAFENQAEAEPINTFEDPEGLFKSLLPGSVNQIVSRLLAKKEQLDVESDFELLESWPAARLNIMRLPKSLELFDFMLALSRFLLNPADRVAKVF